MKADKDAKNPHFKNEYVTLDNLLSVIIPLANDQKLAIYHYIDSNSLVTVVKDAE